MTRLFAEAQARGGNALIAMRFDTTELGGNWSEICAYATAVVAVPVTEAAKQTALQLGLRPAGRPPAGRSRRSARSAAPARPAGQRPAGSRSAGSASQPAGQSGWPAGRPVARPAPGGVQSRHSGTPAEQPAG